MSSYIITLILLLNIFFVCIQEFIKKFYLKKSPNGSQMLYNLMMIVGAIPIFIISSGGSLQFHLPTLGYSLLYAVTYSVALIFTMKALMNGSMALTVIILSFALIFPLIAGIIFFGESLSVLGYLSILCLLSAFVLIIKPEESEEKKSVSIKWIIYVSLATIGNGMGSVITKFHRTAYPDTYASELMIMGLFGVLLVCIVLFFSEYKKCKRYIVSPIDYKGTFLITTAFGLFTGICNGVANYSYLILLEKIPLLALTLLGKGGIFIVTFLASVFVFKETMTYKQKLGFLLGVLSIILLSL